MSIRAVQRAHDLGRASEIARVFVKHGLGDALHRLGLARFVGLAGSVLRWRSADEFASKQPEVRMREAFEELGPCFVKLGQLLAGRPDLLPPEWVHEFSKLREDVAPVPFEALRAQLTEDLGADPDSIFRNLDPEPLAAGSIAQVHRAELDDGTPVVLKIRRPFVKDAVDSDLRLLLRLAERLEGHAELRRYSPRAVVRHFARVLHKELDLTFEARHADRLRSTLGENDPVVVQCFYAEWTRERLCVMDCFEGPSLGEWIRGGFRGGPHPMRVARAGTDAILRMIFVEGVYHSDPHAGNVILLPDGRLGLIDFGQIGMLSISRRAEFFDLLAAFIARRPDEVAELLLGWSAGSSDSETLEEDCAEFIERYRDRRLNELRAADLIRDIHALARANGLMFPPDVALLLKVFITLEDLGRALDPTFAVSTYVEPFVRKQGAARKVGLRGMARAASDLANLALDLPGDLRRLRMRVRQGRMRLSIDVEGLERLGGQLDRSVNHLTIGMITAALIVGTAISLTIDGGPRVSSLPLFGVLGFTSSIVIGIWWIVVTRRRA